ncbi:MAG: cadherin repeat domain-containing protein [Cytophagales bacterium]|nr:cadherin repeat domain-containing protein [Cytophagales bacterium]
MLTKKLRIALILSLLVLGFSCSEEEDPAPTITVSISEFTGSIDENPENGASLGTVSASTNSGSVTYEIVSQTPAGAVAINATSGALTVADASLFVAADNPTITGTIRATNGDVSEEGNFTITVNAVVVEVSIDDFQASIDENPTNGDVIGTITASTNQGEVSLAIASQTPVGAVALDATTGVLTVADASLFVAATNPTISGTITATSGDVTAEASFEITVNSGDINDGFTVYAGDIITFTKSDGADPTEEANQDRITDNVWITRGNTGGQIYNAATESMSDKDNSPVDTEWALGTTEQGIANLTFDKFRTTVKPKEVVDKNMVLHLITDDVYIDIKFTSWSEGNNGTGGGFSYERRSAE